MNVEVEVVREVRTTYLIFGAQSLEAAEVEAERCECDNVTATTRCVKQGPSETVAVYAAWSDPVQVRDGRVWRDVSDSEDSL